MNTGWYINLGEYCVDTGDTGDTLINLGEYCVDTGDTLI